MALPPAVSVAWSAFADAVDVSSMVEADYQRFTAVTLAAHANGVGLDALGDQIIDLSGRDGASEFLAGELTMGLDIALRALAGFAPAKTTATPMADPAAVASARAAAEKAAAEAARTAAMSKLTDDERAALGLK